MNQKYPKILIYILLVLIPLTIYWQSTGFTFVWDDKDPNLLENKYLQNPTLENIIHFWTKPYAQMYIPMSYTVWSGIKQIGTLFPWGQSQNRFNPFIFHLFNVLLHILNGILVFNILKILIKNSWAACMAALLFLLHPLQVESVAWVTELRGLLSAFFGFSALLLLLRNEKKVCQSNINCCRIRYINAIILYLFGLFSKPSVIVIPIILFILYIYYYKKTLLQSLKQLIPLFLITIPFILVVQKIQPASYHKSITPLLARPLVWMDSINFYLLKTIIPYPLVVTYSRTFDYLKTNFYFYLEWLIPLVVFFLIIKFSKKNNTQLIAFFIFIVGFLPVSGLISFVFQKWSNVADRYMYFSMFGVAYIFSFIIKKYFSRKIIFACFALLISYALISAFIQIPTWKDPISLWTHSLKCSRPNAFAYNNRGAAYNEMQEYGKAINDFNKALTLFPDDTSSLNNRGFALTQINEYDKALVDFDKALKYGTTYYDVYINRGNALKGKGEVDQAIKNYKRSIALNSSQSKPYYNIGLVFTEKGILDSAIIYFNKAISKTPNYLAAYLNRGIAYAGIKQYDEAIYNYNLVLKINPNDEMAFSNRGIVYLDLKKFTHAENNFSKAIEINPKRAQTYFLRAKARKGSGNINMALQDIEKALEIEPEFVDALLLKGLLYAEKNEFAAAIKVIEKAHYIEQSNVNLLTVLGDLNIKNKNFTSAIRSYTDAISLDPDNPSLYQKRAVGLFYLMKYKKAQKDVVRSQELGGNVPQSFIQSLSEKLSNM